MMGATTVKTSSGLSFMDIADCRERRVGQANVSLSKMCSKLKLLARVESLNSGLCQAPGHLQGMGLASFVASRIYKNLEPDLFSFE